MNQAVLKHLPPEHVEVEIWRADALEVRRGLSSELDEMWSYVRSKANPRWLWHAIDHHTGAVLAYVFGRRQDTVFLTLKALLELFGVTRYFTERAQGVATLGNSPAIPFWKVSYVCPVLPFHAIACGRWVPLLPVGHASRRGPFERLDCLAFHRPG